MRAATASDRSRREDTTRIGSQIIPLTARGLRDVKSLLRQLREAFPEEPLPEDLREALEGMRDGGTHLFQATGWDSVSIR